MSDALIGLLVTGGILAYLFVAALAWPILDARWPDDDPRAFLGTVAWPLVVPVAVICIVFVRVAHHGVRAGVHILKWRRDRKLPRARVERGA